MKKMSIGDLAGQIYKLLEDLSTEERVRVLAATSALFGDVAASATSVVQSGNATNSSPSQFANISDVARFFEDKKPKSKVEELAVAARFRELAGHETHTKDELKNVFQVGRRYFDAANFARDIDNANRKAGFFLPSPSRGHHQLSAVGQKFVDTLPNREIAKTIRKARKPRGKNSKK